MSNNALGRGLDSLIPTDLDISDLSIDNTTDRIMRIKSANIKPNPHQPRRDFDEAELSSLSESIREHGILQPLLVTDEGNGSYQLIAGERRLRAAKTVGLDTVPVIVVTADDVRKAELALIENVQREDLRPLELSAALTKLHNDFGLDYEAIGSRIGKAPTTVINIMRLMQLPDSAKEALGQGKISEGHARAILGLRDHPEKQDELLALVIKHDWSVRKAESFVVAYKQGARTSQQALRSTTITTPETKQLSERLGTSVSLRRMAKGGQLQIAYKDDDDLKRLIDGLAKR